MATTYTNIEQLLVKEAGRIGPEIYRKTVDNNVWLKLVKQDTFPEEMGDRVSVLTYERSIPQAARNGLQNDYDLQSVWQGNDSILGSNPTDQNYLTFNAYTQGNASPGTSPISSTSSAGNVNTPLFANVEFGQKLRTYDLRRVALESPNISLEDLRYPVRRKEQLSQIINILTEQTAMVWTQRYQDEYVRLSENLVTPTGTGAGATLTTVSNTNGSTKFSPLNDATSKLTQGILRRLYMRLLRDGAGSSAQGKENGAPVFNLITSAETSEDIIKLNADIRSDFRYSKPNELLAPLGVERSYGGFYHIIDPYPPRYSRIAKSATGSHASTTLTVSCTAHGLEVGDVVTLIDSGGAAVSNYTNATVVTTANANTFTLTGTAPAATVDAVRAWKRVYPFTRAASTKGFKYDINSDYLAAAYEDSIILINEVYHSVVPKPLGSMGGMSFDPQSYRGDFKWKNIIDRETNPDGTVGYFRALFASGSKPVRPEWGYVIRHKRGEAALDFVA
jgi:hypothetical protein